MKILRRVSLGLVCLVLGAVLYQMGFSTLVKPWELHRSLQSGCKVWSANFLKTSFSPQEQVDLFSSFTKAAWLDHNYLPLAQASVIYAKKFASLGDLQQNETYKAQSLLFGFCFKTP